MNFRTLALLLTMAACTGRAIDRPVDSVPPPTPVQPVSKPIPWEYDIPTAVAHANMDGRPMLLYFYNDYCDWCLKMDNGALMDARVKQMLGHYVNIKVDTMSSKLHEELGLNEVPAFLIVTPTKEGPVPVGLAVGYKSVEQFLYFLVLVNTRIDGGEKTAVLTQ